jgi:hypothetical protein
MVRQLKREGCNDLFLIIIDSQLHHPDHQSSPARSLRETVLDFIATLQRQSRTRTDEPDAALLANLMKMLDDHEPAGSTERGLERVLDAINDQYLVSEKISRTLLQRMYRAFSAGVEAKRKYRGARVEVDALLLCAGKTESKTESVVRAARSCIAGTLEVVTVSTDHFGFLRPPVVRETAVHIQHALNGHREAKGEK